MTSCGQEWGVCRCETFQRVDQESFFEKDVI